MKKSIFPKSEKWLPVFVIIWASLMVTAGFIGAWYDAERYTSMMEAIGQSVTLIVGVIVGASQYFSKIRHSYKELIIKTNGNVPKGSDKDEISKKAL